MAELGEIPDQEGMIQDLHDNMEELNLNNVSIKSRFSAFKSPNKGHAERSSSTNFEHSNSAKTPEPCGSIDHTSTSPTLDKADPLYKITYNPVNTEPLPQRLHKRKRVPSADINNLSNNTTPTSSNESITTKPVDKKHKQNSKQPIHAIKHVSFDLQNNPEPEPANPVPDEDYEVIKEAAPIWRSALTHRTHENRAMLRATMYKEFIEGNINPLWTYGLERIPDYLKPLSATMLSKFHANAKELTDLAYNELLAKNASEKQMAANHESITKTLYQEAGNPDFNKSLNRASGILSAYRSQEIRKTNAYKVRESTNRPSSDKEWREALETQKHPSSTSQDRSRPANQGGNKRRRSNTRSPRRGPSPGPSNRGRGRGRGRGNRGRGGRSTSSTPPSDKEAALFSALRAFMK